MCIRDRLGFFLSLALGLFGSLGRCLGFARGASFGFSLCFDGRFRLLARALFCQRCCLSSCLGGALSFLRRFGFFANASLFRLLFSLLSVFDSLLLSLTLFLLLLLALLLTRSTGASSFGCTLRMSRCVEAKSDVSSRRTETSIVLMKTHIKHFSF